jgi:hypothetical protein
MTWKDYSHFVVLWCCFALVFLTLALFRLFLLVRLVKNMGSANPSSRASSRPDRL